MDTKIKTYRPSLAFYKANANGTGSAMKMELHPAHGDTAGCIMMYLASQKTVGDYRGPNPIYPTFDWENAICVKLDFIDLSKMLQVFRGECESIEEGRGLVHRSPKGLTYIKLAHLVEPLPGYMFEVKRTRQGEDDGSLRIFLTPAEALGTVMAIESSMGVLVFGVPMVVEHS